MLRWTAVGVLIAIGCSSNDTAPARPIGNDGGFSGTGGGTPGALGIGAKCTNDKECRVALLCDKKLGTCQPGHSNVAGSPCVLSDDCMPGLYCGDGKCVSEGPGKNGDKCVDDADCTSGLRCVLNGLASISCKPEGMVDLDGACKKSSDCYAGLICDGGACKAMPKGGSPHGKVWPGSTCDDEGGPVHAYFRVPRHDGLDGDYFRLPFPNDIRTKGGAPDFVDFPDPGGEWLGYDLMKRWTDAAALADGWGADSSVYFRFSGALDPNSIAGQVQIVDLDADAQLGFAVGYTAGPGKFICTNRVIVSRQQGRIWESGTRYAVLLLDGVKTSDGKAVEKSPDLVAVLGATMPGDAALSAPWTRYQPLRDYLSKHGLAGKVLDATVFTTGHPRAAADAIAKAVAAQPVPAASGWVRCDTGVPSPCPDATGERACGKAAAGFDELHALVELPIFQDGAAPYLDAGGGITIASGVAKVAHTDKVCLSLTVPSGAAPAQGWPLVVYAHGTGGHFRSHVVAGFAAELAAGVDDGYGNVVKAAVLGVDQVQHGPRAAGSTVPPAQLFFNVANPQAMRGNALQAAADQLSLLRFAASVSFTAQTSPTKTAFKLGSPVAFWGHDQGATTGAIALPYGAFRGALVAGLGAGIKDLLAAKRQPWDIATILAVVLQDYVPGGKLRLGADHPAVNVMQIVLDGGDPLTFAHVTADQHQLQIFGTKDTYTFDAVQVSWTLAANLGVAINDASAAGSAFDIGMLTPLAIPAIGNRKVGNASITAIARQYGPDSGKDGHFVIADVPSARADAERFVAGVLSGAVPRVGK